MWEKDRKKLVEWGIGDAEVRKNRSNTTSAPSGGLWAKTAYGTKYVIPLDFEVISTHGAFYPRVLSSELQFEVTLADTTNILGEMGTAISGTVHPYKMTNIELQYETVHSEALARTAMSEYSAGKAFLYEHVTLYKTFSFVNNVAEHITQSINIPRRSMTGLLMLFVSPFEAGKRNSEAFANPAITKVSVSINGVPNKVYSQGLDQAAIYGEVVRKFQDFVSPKDFFDNKYALWVDMRTTDDDGLHGQGLKLQNTQDGVTVEIRRTKHNSDTTKYNCYVFVVSDAQMSIEGNQLKSIAY